MPGKRWNDELTRKNVPSTKIAEGSGAKPHITGFLYVEGIGRPEELRQSDKLSPGRSELLPREVIIASSGGNVIE